MFYSLVRGQYKKLLTNLNISLKRKKVLDAGSGIGEYTLFLEKIGAKVTAIDVSKEALITLREKSSNAIPVIVLRL